MTGKNFLYLSDEDVELCTSACFGVVVDTINADDGSTDPFKGAYSRMKAQGLKAASFDRVALGARGLGYERLDQLTIELLLGAR